MYIPRKSVLRKTATSAQILNVVRKYAPANYRAAVPRAENNLAGIQFVGQIVMGDEGLYNSFISTLFNRIGKVVIQSKLYRNPLEALKMGYMEVGDVIEELFVNLVRSHQFDPETAEQKIFGREIPEVLSAFHKINFKKFYKITISYDELRGAFLTWNGIHDLVGRILEQAYTSHNLDEFIMFKYLMIRAIVDKMVYPVTVPAATSATIKDITVTMVDYSNKLTFMDTAYNAMGVPNFTDKDDQILLLNTRFAALQNIEVLATAFNMDKAELQGRTIMLNNISLNQLEIDRLNQLADGQTLQVPTADEMALANTVSAMVVDKSFFMVLDQIFELKNVENGEGLYWNYWLHTWKMFSYSPFANAIAYTTSDNTVTAVTLSPTTASVKKGASASFTATVTTTGLAGEGVTYALSGDAPVTSTVDPNGLVTVAVNEENTKLTLTATSVFDATKIATSTITVTA